MPSKTFIRLVRLQHLCWQHGHKKWAKALGERCRELRRDYPQLSDLG